VYTEATANLYAPLPAPVRVLDTRSSAGRANIVNASGNLDSKGRLKAGKTIYVNLDGLVYFADAIFANLTVTEAAGSGYLTVWSGAGTSRPTASSVDFAASGSLASFVSCGLAEYSAAILNVIAIYASQATQVILDVAGFAVPGFQFARYTTAGSSASARASRILGAQERMRAARS
jgi:hypothetical protein